MKKVDGQWLYESQEEFDKAVDFDVRMEEIVCFIGIPLFLIGLFYMFLF